MWQLDPIKIMGHTWGMGETETGQADQPGEPVDEVVCPNCGAVIRARMSDASDDKPLGRDERVSFYPMDPEDVLRKLLNTPREDS